MSKSLGNFVDGTSFLPIRRRRRRRSRRSQRRKSAHVDLNVEEEEEEDNNNKGEEIELDFSFCRESEPNVLYGILRRTTIRRIFEGYEENDGIV